MAERKAPAGKDVANEAPRRALQSCADEAYRAILRAIVELELTPGQVISAYGLARSLGVSRTPVREALKRLEALGFVKSMPQSGTLVLGIDAEALRHTTEMREVLEVWAVRRVAQSGEGAAELRRLIAQQEKAREDEDVHAYLAADEEFHACIARSSGNPKLVELLANLNLSLLRARFWAFRFAPLRPRQGTKEHAAIVDAIDAGDPDQAAELMRAHVWGTFNTLEASLSRQSPFWA